jgi:hypothetical protein
MDDEYFIEIDKWGNKHWRNKDGEFHRLDGPAIEWPNGDKQWWKKRNLHRSDGPAIEEGGYKAWWKNGVKFPDKDSFFESLTEEEKKIALFSEDFLNG